jgi:hypothetical protein
MVFPMIGTALKLLTISFSNSDKNIIFAARF